MKKHLMILLTSVFMGLVFALSLNTSAKAATPAWECSTSKGDVTLEGTCFFSSNDSSLEVTNGYTDLDFTITNNSEANFTNLYYKNIVTGGNVKVDLTDGTKTYGFSIPVSMKTSEIQTIQVSYILDSNPTKIQTLYLDTMKETVKPVISFEYQGKDANTYAKDAKFAYTVTEEDQDDVGLAEVKLLWRSYVISLPTESAFAKAENQVANVTGWLQSYESAATYQPTDVAGNYQLCALAKDFAGNSTIACSTAAKIDTVKPNLAYKNLEDLSKWYTEYKVSYEVFDNSGEEVEVKYYVNEQEVNSKNGFILNADNTVDGDNKVYIEATDSVGNVAKTEVITVKMVNSPLTYKESYVGEEIDGIYKDSLTYKVDVEGNIKVVVSYKLNDGEWQITNSPNLEVVVNLDGVSQIHIKVEDEAGRTAEFSSKEFEIDATAAEIVLLELEGANENGWFKNEIAYTLEVEGDDFVLTYSIDGENWLAYNYDEVIAYLKSSQGLVSVTFKATDRVGHESVKSIEANIDSLADEISTTWDGSKIAVGKNLEITIEVLNSTSPVVSLTYINVKTGQETEIIDNKFFVSENGEYVVKAIDMAGNISESPIQIIEFYDFADEYALELDNNDWTNENVHIVLTEKGNSVLTFVRAYRDQQAFDFDLTNMSVEITENGTYTVEVENEAGYQSILTIEVNNIDREQDEIVVTDNNTGNWIGRYEFSVNASFKGSSPVGSVSYAVVPEGEVETEDDFTLINLEETVVVDNISGNYYAVVNYKDAAGNETSWTSSLIMIDGSLPVGGKIIAAPSEYTNQDITITFLPFENVIAEGDVTHYYRVNKLGEELTEFVLLEDFNLVYTITEEGVYSVDLKGINDFEKESVITLLVTKDTTAPNVSLTTNANGDEYVNKLEAEVAADEEVKIEYQIIKEGEEVTEDGYIVLEGNVITTDSLETGKYVLTVKVTDKAGNEVVETEKFNIDMEKPMITLNGTVHIYDKGQSIGFTVTDNIKVKQVKYVLSESLTPDNVSKGFTIVNDAIVLPDIEDGNYYLYIEAEDEAGNKTVIVQIITLDTMAPVLEGVVNNGFYNETVTIKIVEATPYEICINNEDCKIGVSNTTIEVSENGYYSLSVVDYLGHKTNVSFVVNKEGTAIINETEVSVSNQKYLPILKDDKGYYVQLPAGTYPEKKVLVFSKLVNENMEVLDQDPNYLYLSATVRDELKDGYRFAIEDYSAVLKEANEEGHYGYVVVNTLTLDEADKLEINPVVIDNKAVSLVTGLTGVISVLGIFIINRSRRLVRI